MIDLEKTGNLGSVSVKALADALNGNENSIQLPSFQRDAVWDETHVEKYWDSILQGFPVGSLLFARVANMDVGEMAPRRVQVAGSGLSSRTSSRSKSVEFLIIDGQQRSITTALGLRLWKKGDVARLWIDLGKSMNIERHPSRFFLCSALKPWGLGATIAMQREAATYLDSDAKDRHGNLCLNDNTLKYTWPVRAQLPVPLSELIRWLEVGRPGSWTELLPVPLREQHEAQDIDLEDLFRSIKSLGNYRIPVFLAENLTPEKLGEVFQRLNKQGYEMTGEELFFSAIKMVWPKAHDLVWDAYGDMETGRFLQPTKIIHLATRLVAKQQDSDVLSLNQKEFSRLIQAENQDRKFIDELQDLLRPKEKLEAGVGHLHLCLRKARAALSYLPEQDANDPGLPSILLARLRWRVWHTLVAWLYHHDTVDSVSRLEMIRYALLDHFYTKGSASALTREPFKFAFEASGEFPGLAIYEFLSTNQFLDADILTPSRFAEQLGMGKESEPVWSIVQNEREIGMWGQRRYFSRWFPSFDPTLYRTQADLPYDVDHILPKSYKDMRGRHREQKSGIFWVWREPVINGPGNFRYWPSSLNKIDGNKNIDAKFLVGEPEQVIPEDSYLHQFELESVGDIRAASLISEESVEDWVQGANIGYPYDWHDEDRMRALRRAVDSRRLRIYTELYEQLAWKEWVDKVSMALADRIRKFVIDTYLVPGRESGQLEVVIQSGVVHEAMGLLNRMPAVCGALDAKKFAIFANVEQKDRTGPKYGATVEWRFRV